MDAFFASIEERDDPSLQGKPVAVGFDSERGVVSTANYEARRFGVHSALSIQVAKRRCPQLIIVPVRHHYYREVSRQVHQIFLDYTDIIEPLSIDEAFLDVTSNKKNWDMAVDIAKDIRRRIHEELHLTASAGVSFNKFLAKIASDYRKPDGLCVIHPDMADDFIGRLPVEDFWGVGPRTAARMHQMGIFTGVQLRDCSLSHLEKEFGKVGRIYYLFARGIDERPVETESSRKSVGCEHTFEEDISSKSAVIIRLYHVVLELVERIQKADFEGKTLVLKVKYADFTQITRSVTGHTMLRTKDQILPMAKQLLRQVDYSSSHPIRLMGLAVGNPSENGSDDFPRWMEGDLLFEE